MTGPNQSDTERRYTPIPSANESNTSQSPTVSSVPVSNGSSSATPTSETTSTEKTPLLPSSHPPSAEAVAQDVTKVDVGSDSDSDDDIVVFRRGEKKKKKLDYWRICSFMLPYALPQSLRLRFISVSVLTLTIVLRVLALVPAYALKLAVDSVADRNPQPPYFAILLYFGTQMLSSALGSVKSTAKEILVAEIKQRFAVDAFKTLVDLDFHFHTRQKSGNRFAIIWRGAYSVKNLMDTVLFNALPTCFECIVVVAIFFHLKKPLISLIVFVSVVIYWVISKFRTDVIVKQNRRSNEVYDDMSAQEVDTLMNIETVKMFGNEDPEVEKYDGLRTEVRRMDINYSSVAKVFGFATGFVTKGATSLSLLVAAVGAANGSITAGDFVLINAYIGQLFSPLMGLSGMYSSLLRSASSVEAVIKVFDRESAVPDMPNSTDVHEVGYAHVRRRRRCG